MSKNTIPISMQTLTPVHIGSGEQLQGNFDYLYFQDEAVVAVIDAAKILGIIGAENIDKWVSVIDNQGNLLNDLPQLRHISSAQIAKRILSIFDKAPNPEKNHIKEQTHLGNHQPVIPGSSLKGAVRTAILTKLIRDNATFASKERHLKDRKGRFNDNQVVTEYLAKEVLIDRKTRRPKRDRDGNVLTRYSANKDMMRFLRVSDFYFEAQTTVVKNTVINLFNSGWAEKKQESAYWECIPKDATAKGHLQLPRDLIQQVQNKNYITRKDYDLSLLEPKKLFKLINQHTANLLDRELSFWNDEDNPLAIGDHANYLENIETLVKNCDENTCIMRVGASNGWEFMTGSWASDKDAYDDFILSDATWNNLKKTLRKKRYDDDMIFPKTRKMIEGGMPLGFVKLSII